MFYGSQQGRTMIEMILVLGIIASVSIGIVHLISSAYDKFRVSRSAQQVEELRKLISNRYVALGDYSTMTAAELIKDSVVPSDMVSSSTTLQSVFGQVRVVGYPSYFSVIFTNVPQSGCIELAMVDWVIADSSDLINMRILNPTRETYFRWPGSVSVGGIIDKVLPVELSDASSACAQRNVMVWNFQ